MKRSLHHCAVKWPKGHFNPIWTGAGKMKENPRRVFDEYLING